MVAGRGVILDLFDGPRLSPTHSIARTPDELSAMVRAMKAHPERAFDLETSGLRYADGDYPIGYSVGYLSAEGEYRAWYVPFAHSTMDAQASPDSARQAFIDALAGASALVGHNLKFDLNMARAHGFTVPDDAALHDTWIQGHLVYESRRLKLEALAEAEGVTQYLPWDDPWEVTNELDDFLKNRALTRRLPFKKDDKRAGVQCYLTRYGHSEVPVALEAEYSCRDIGHTLMLDRVQRARAMGVGQWYEERRRYLYWNEMMLVRALAEMEWIGQACDAQYLRALDDEADRRMAEFARELTQAFGATIDWRNDNQVRDLLYHHLKMPVVKLTERDKKPAVDRSAMLQLGAHPEVDERYKPALRVLAEHNAWLKVWQTYTLALAWWVGRDGRIHASFNQPGTKTGRLSADSPNLQNIPTRHKETAKRIRAAFIMDPGMTRIYADYSQIELRILAWATGNRTLLGAYASPAYDALCRGEIDYPTYVQRRKMEPSVDVHAEQAMATFGSRPDSPNWGNERRAAKVINFGVPYGMGPQGLMTNPDLLLPEDQARDYFARYTRANPEIPETKTALFSKMLSEDVPHFINWAGRAVHARGLRAKNKDVRSEAERSTFASLIQGSAGELTRFSIVAMYLAQREGRLPAAATSTVHDEIQADCATSDAPFVAWEMRRMMEDFTGRFGPVPIVCGLESTTTTWADKQEMDL